MVRQRKLRGGALAAVVMTVVAGCGAGGGDAAGSAGAAAAGRDGGGLVRRAADVLVSTGSSRASTALETAAGGTRLTIRGSGAYDYRQRRGRLDVALPDETRAPINEILMPGVLYMRNRGAGVPAGKWVRVDTGSPTDGNLVTGGAIDPLLAAELLRGARTAAYVGDEDFAGVKVRHYRGEVDLSHAARVARPYARGALAVAAEGFAGKVVPFDAYLDGEGRLRKVRQRFRYANRGHSLDVASTTLLYGFGVAVKVDLPAKGDIYAGKIKP
ncbi:hypothetical protein [Streptomyces sp. NPDC050504]|uniref:hypothetical protein n=1 Tax=Streptomyces sp. NPDC050504 TaxID=3365618 RepID=UPI0037BB0CC3